MLVICPRRRGLPGTIEEIGCALRTIFGGQRQGVHADSVHERASGRGLARWKNGPEIVG